MKGKIITVIVLQEEEVVQAIVALLLLFTDFILSVLGTVYYHTFTLRLLEKIF